MEPADDDALARQKRADEILEAIEGLKAGKNPKPTPRDIANAVADPAVKKPTLPIKKKK